MHVSLDSALGRQRRLNSVGESVLQIAPNAAAAYSLRSLTGGDPKVVRVRRGSDNHEQDFTASEVSSGALTSFVNAQVTPPLDIKALTATGRDGDFLIAKAAYSLRSLGTRQATLAATGDTVARADGKYVCQVRRSSDDAVKSFTAAEVTDGTLLAFTNADYAKYTSDFSSGDDSWGAFDDVTETGNIDGIGGLDDNLRLAIGSATSNHRAFRSNVLPVNQKFNFSARIFIPSTNSVVDSIIIRDASNNVIVASTTPTQDQWVTVTANNVTLTNAQLRVNLQDGGVNTFAGNGSDVIYLREITVTQVTSDGFVKTWYDQSVTNQAGDTATGNHAVQGTAADQPKIVNAGALVADSGIDFDGSQTLVATSVLGMGATATLISASVRDNGSGAVISLGSSASSSNTYFATTEGGSVSQTTSRNTTSVSINASVSGATRLSFSLTTGQTSTKSGALGGALVESTSDYGSDFTSGELDTITFGKLRPTSGTLFDGRVREALIYDTDQTDNRTAIEANIGEAYSIDLPSGVDPGFDQVDGFVETWYDQSGNSNNAVQATAGSQPKIVNAGSLLADGLTFDGSDDSMATTSAINSTNIAIACVSKSANNATAGIFSMLDGFNDGHEALYLAGEIRIASNSSDLDVSITTTNQNLYFANYDGSTQSLSSNGGTPSTKSTSQTISVSSVAQIGSRSGGNRLNGSIEEIIVYTADQSANRTALETNILSHYGIS